MVFLCFSWVRIAREASCFTVAAIRWDGERR
ncbi:hypothetical protein PSEUDO8Z_30103 [Pseudomonas sp. 8Z]|nr:hypothetical protein PSEUDO8Z_30103 [Pseudomonas sp. 8Z]